MLLQRLLCFAQEEDRLERQEDRLHQKAVNAALHGNFGKAVVLEVKCLKYAENLIHAAC